LTGHDELPVAARARRLEERLRDTQRAAMAEPDGSAAELLPASLSTYVDSDGST
jgi:hypothetical protein